MNIYGIGVLLSFAIYIIVGNYAGRAVKGMDDYYVSGRNAPTILIVGTLVASYVSTNAMLGETGFSYDGYPIPMLIVIILNGAGYIIGSMFFGRYLRRSEALTVPQYFGKRFNSRKVRQAAGGTAILALLGYLLAATQGSSILLSQVLGIRYEYALVLVWIGYTSFTFYSGSRGVIITDTMMFFVFIVALLASAPLLVREVGGWETLINSLANFDLKSGILSWEGKVGLSDSSWATGGQSLVWALINGLAWGIAVGISPWQSSRYLMAKDEHVVIRSSAWATILIPLLYIPIAIIGTSINLIKPDLVPEQAYIWAALNVLPTFVGILVLCGIIAAGLSSCSTFLSLIGFSVTIDIYDVSKKDEKTQLRISKIVMLLSGMIVLVIAYLQPPAIFWVTYFSGTVVASSWCFVAFGSVWSKKITAPAAFWGMIIGFAGNAVFKVLDIYGFISLPVYFDPIMIGLVMSLITVLLITSKTTVTEEEKLQRDMLFVVPEEIKNKNEIQITNNYPKIMFISGVLMIAFFVLMYAIPYGKAIGF